MSFAKQGSQACKSPMPFDAFNRKVLYGYSINDADHIGMVKVGDTTIKSDKLKNVTPEQFKQLAEEAAHKRIQQDIKVAAAVRIEYKLEFAEIIWHDPHNNFRDYAIHEILEYNGFERVKFDYTKAREWFKAETKDIVDALNAYKNGYKSIDNDKFKKVITLRNEQVAVRNNTLEAIKLGDTIRLWDCKPRFGKTTTGIAMLLESHTNPNYNPLNSNLIITHRPDVIDSWFNEFEIMMGETDWQFSSKKHGISFDKIDPTKPHIVFMSLQDLRGKDKQKLEQFKKSNNAIYTKDWDMLFVDEAHEGNDTELANEVHKGLKRDFTVYLSGTPFKYLASGKFQLDQIDTWDYVQEQEAKRNWDYSNGENPYRLQPQLWINAIDLSEELKGLFSNGVDASAFDFNELFKLNSNDKFVHEAHIKNLLKRMQGDGEPKNSDADPTEEILPEPHMPFSKSFLDSTKHTIWVMPPNVKACRAMGELLKEDNFFKDYGIVVAAGSDTTESKNALQSVKNAIKEFDKTITLTVGKLTTGVTVPEWTGVIMLTNMSSAALYTQTIFRAQSPYESDGKTKENVYVWDFAPDRVLQIISEVAGVSSKASSMNGEAQRIRLDNMLNFMPIIAYTSAGDFKQFNAGEISIKLKAFYAERAINAGFETPVLFRKDLENVPSELRKAIQDLYIASGSSSRVKEPKWEVIISHSGDATPEYEYIDNPEAPEIIISKEKTAEEIALIKQRKELLKERENMRNILYAVSSRIPFILLAKMCDEDFRKKLKLGHDFGFKELSASFDDESWKEFFGTISKELFVSLEEAFDMDTTRGAILTWIDNVQESLKLIEIEPQAYAEHVYNFMKKIKNPNKETVFTPADVVKLVYETAGFKEDANWSELYLSGAVAAQQGIDPFPTFYDINTKSGLFPMLAANHLFQNSSGRSWTQVCNESIYANARTLAGKWATCSLLGMPQDWSNITVIDVVKEIASEDTKHLSNEGKNLFLSHFLMSPRHNSCNPESVLSDISNVEERKKVISIVEEFDKDNKKFEKDFKENKMSKESLSKSKKDLESRVKKELNSSKQFDYTISNPPYQATTAVKEGQQQPTVTNIFHLFQILAMQISNRTTMIYPAGRWMQQSGKGLKHFGHMLINFKGLKSVQYFNLNETLKLFPSTGINDGVSIVDIEMGNFNNNGKFILNGHKVSSPGDSIITLDPTMEDIHSKIANTMLLKGMKTLSHRGFLQKLYGIESSFAEVYPEKVFLLESYSKAPSSIKEPIKLLTNDKSGKAGRATWFWTDKSNIKKNQHMISRWQVVIQSALFENRKIRFEIIDNNSAHGRAKVSLADFGTKTEAENFINTMETNFMKVLFNESLAGGLSNIASFVPEMPDYKKSYSDKELFAFFGMTEEQIEHLNKKAGQLK